MPGIIQIGTEVLNPNMLWIERHKSQNVAQTVKRVLGGAPVVFAVSLALGDEVTLQATEDYGWLTLAQVQAVEAMAVTPGATFILTIGTDILNVAFRHNTPPAVDMNPLIHRTDEAAGDYFIGSLKFITV